MQCGDLLCSRDVYEWSQQYCYYHELLAFYGWVKLLLTSAELWNEVVVRILGVHPNTWKGPPVTKANLAGIASYCVRKNIPHLYAHSPWVEMQRELQERYTAAALDSGAPSTFGEDDVDEIKRYLENWSSPHMEFHLRVVMTTNKGYILVKYSDVEISQDMPIYIPLFYGGDKIKLLVEKELEAWVTEHNFDKHVHMYTVTDETTVIAMPVRSSGIGPILSQGTKGKGYCELIWGTYDRKTYGALKLVHRPLHHLPDRIELVWSYELKHVVKHGDYEQVEPLKPTDTMPDWIAEFRAFEISREDIDDEEEEGEEEHHEDEGEGEEHHDDENEEEEEGINDISSEY
jgi:hypothetical protein